MSHVDYQPLDATKYQIRLLTVELTEALQLDCHLTVVSLDDTLEYKALSYIWGTGWPTHCIWVDDNPYWIRPNLFDYLLLAAKFWPLGRGIFIDAICINQYDVEERNSQVALMGRLYTGASEVTVWFGMEHSWATPLAYRIPAIWDPDILRSCLIDEETEYLTAEEFQDVRQTFHCYLSRHEYWSRLWTVQEYRLADRLLLRVGLLAFDDLSFVTLIQFSYGVDRWAEIVRRGDHDATRSARALASRVVTSPLSEQALLKNAARSIAFHVGRATHERGSARKGTMPLYRAVMLFSEQNCGNIRDHIFGLLGLCDSIMVPDYGVSIIQMYTHVLTEGMREIQASADLERDGMPRTIGLFIAALSTSLGLRFDQPGILLVTFMAFDNIGLIGTTMQEALHVITDLRHPHLYWLLCRVPRGSAALARVEARILIKRFRWRLILGKDKRVYKVENESRTFMEWSEYVTASQRRFPERRQQGRQGVRAYTYGSVDEDQEALPTETARNAAKFMVTRGQRSVATVGGWSS
ncbi:hypothetical protein LTR17_012693 [Elasticomyces elasticus]|nr:hypothetical protein LTR17_012693 [Elasticomyces elasticus]